MIDRGHGKTPFLIAAPVLAVLLASTGARANGDHPMRLPPPDPGPALAAIAAMPEVTPPPPPAIPPAPFAPAVAAEPGRAIFNPFSASGATAPSNAVVQPAGSAGAAGGDVTFTLVGVLACLAVGGYFWLRRES
jgi:hypothetical protein